MDIFDDIAVIRLGRAAGKMKYLLVDNDENVLADRKNKFEVRVQLDPNGCGIRVVGWVRDLTQFDSPGMLVKDFIWQAYHGPVSPDLAVVNKNGIALDCRLSNLELVSEEEFEAAMKSPLLTSGRIEETVYWKMVCGVVVNPFDELLSCAPVDKSSQYYSRDGDLEGGSFTLFYECHYAPCIKTERSIGEFGMCSRCTSVRYCSGLCQQRDWRVHKKFCFRRKFLPPTSPSTEHESLDR